MEVAASGVAFVSIAFQLTETCVKLYKFWESVEDAPQEIAAIREDLHYLSSVFAGIGCNGKPLGQFVVEGIQHCELKMAELNTIVERLDVMFKSSSRRRRVWAAFKATAQAKQVQRFRESLSETKATLTLAMIHQCVLQPPTFTLSAETNIFQNLPSRHADSQAVSNSSLNSSLQRPPPYQRIPPRTRGHTFRAVPPTPHGTTSPHALTYYHQPVSEKSLITPKFQELMHSAIQAGPKFAPTSLETFSQDGYTMTNNGVIHSKTFVYSKYLHYRIQHHTSSFRTAFGCLWIRTTEIHDDCGSDKSDNTDEDTAQKPQTVTSVVFYPTYWVQRLGIKNGLEALMAAGSRSWLLNCRITVTCAVPEDALIFELCRTGQTKAVQALLSRGVGSVVDTSPKGWKPLHYAAAGGHVDLCALLIREGAEKTALVYEGPSPSILSPISIFVASASESHAETKISMLRLFSDCIDISSPSDDGWSVHEWLKRAYAKERVPISQNSITWLLHLTAKEEYVEFSARTVWCALQHALRSLFAHESDGGFFARILDGLPAADQAPAAAAITSSPSQVRALSLWLALRVGGREILPMALHACSALQMRGFDWEEDDIPHAQFVKALPEVYGAWCHAVLRNVEKLDEYMRLEFETCKRDLGWEGADTAWEDGDKAEILCAECGDDYTTLSAALVEPARIARAECVRTEHKFKCTCQDFSSFSSASASAIHIPQLPAYAGSWTSSSSSCDYDYDSDSDCDSDSGFFDAEDYFDSEAYLDAEPYPLVYDQDPTPSVFADIALQLYRSHGRVWMGEYAAGERLCATCFLCREQYVSEDGLGVDFPAMPDSFEGLRVAR